MSSEPNFQDREVFFKAVAKMLSLGHRAAVVERYDGNGQYELPEVRWPELVRELKGQGVGMYGLVDGKQEGGSLFVYAVIYKGDKPTEQEEAVLARRHDENPGSTPSL